MATKPNVKAVQDMPPSGGYPKVIFSCERSEGISHFLVPFTSV